MSNVLTFPSSDHRLERNDPRLELMESRACQDETQMAMRGRSALRAKTRLEIEDAIAAIESGYARIRESAQTLEYSSVRTKLQNDLGLLEQKLQRAKSEISRL